MLIFIDSNILCSNYHMKGPSFEVAQRVGTIVLGQIVIDEVCNKFKENLVEQVTKVNNALRDLNKMLPDPPVSLDEIDVEEAIKQLHLLRSMISMTTTALIARIKALICSRRQAFR